MPVLPALLQDAATLAAAGGTLYTAVLAAVALTSVLAATPDRRRDARATLTILMRRRPPR
ncbi:hypothetical protein CP967_22805 [Streptomyces nitrosporeus]|uniref:Uncharacterized protein n=1 Tax=Streptomyces nitrosporeus TaxID=28894 RepID=A0A5J6FD23_9ACTN|nr:hypothetical protein [Streptomyces nitrosporeus]QEU74439.1 hypothetical protein CP967_22805 [Streptomyces nitrosporeus]GGY83056.1 hypothetical protein GCM10010327_11580 [Streptomyces nitrosporeus]